MAAIDVAALVDRIIAIEQEAFAALVPARTVDAVNHFFHEQEVFPYLTHRLGAVTVDGDSEEQDVYTVQIIARVVIGQLTAGYRGQPTDELYSYLPHLMDTLNRRVRLQSAAYPVAMPDLIEARVGSASGFGVFGRGDGTGQVGSDITITCSLINTLGQDYT